MISWRRRYPPGARFVGSVRLKGPPAKSAACAHTPSVRPDCSILNHLAVDASKLLQSLLPQDAM